MARRAHGETSPLGGIDPPRGLACPGVMGKFAVFAAEGTATSLDPNASPTQDEMAATLARVAEGAHSAAGIATALADFLRLLRPCSWLDGDLRMELADHRGGVAVHLFTDRGGVRERALAPVTLAISLDELDVALQGTLGLFAPLRMRHHKGKIVFTQTGIVETLLPPQIEVSSESLVSTVDSNPHEKPTVKRPAYVLPEALRSGVHLRKDSDDDA